MKGKIRCVAIYSRKSKFTGKGESIGNQVELCREYIRNLFGEADAEGCAIFEDEGFSGGDLKRPAFQRMLAEVRKKKYRAIIVYRLDRISRNISDFTGLIDELSRLEVAFISIREQFDTGTPMGRAMMSKPKLLMLDEPSMGLAPILVQQIFDIIKELHEAGTTILLVEQNARKALQIADRAYVLETGNITLTGTGAELAQSDEVRKAYLGG